MLVVISYVKNTTERGRAILGSSDRAVIGRCKTFVLPSAEHDDDDAPLTVAHWNNLTKEGNFIPAYKDMYC